MDIEKDYLRAYKDVERMYPITPNKPREVSIYSNILRRDLTMLTYNFLMAGVTFLANQDNEYIKKIATVAWQEIDIDSSIEVAVESDMVEMALNSGYHIGDAYLKFGRNRDLRIITKKENSWPCVYINYHVVTTPEFVVRAKKDPLSALAETAGLCSQIRDLTAGKHLDDLRGGIMIRANAAIAQILLEGRMMHPEVKLSQENKRLLKKFPEGIGSIRPEMQFRNQEYSDMPSMNYRIYRYVDAYCPDN